MDVTEEDVARWYGLAKAWERADTAAACRETFLRREQLLSFLEKLRREMAEMVNIVRGFWVYLGVSCYGFLCFLPIV